MAAAANYAISLINLKRFKEAKVLLRKTMPVARRVLGEHHILVFRMRKLCAEQLYRDPAATLDDLREAVTTLEDVVRIARRVFGGSHTLVTQTEQALQNARAALCVREASGKTTN